MSIWQAFTGGLLGGDAGRTGIASPWADSSNLAPVVLADVFPGIDPDAMPVTRSVAMALPAVGRCHRLLMGSFVGARLVVMRGAETLAPDAAADYRVIEQPEQGYPPLVTWARVVDDLMWHGVAYLEVAQRWAPSGAGAVRRPRWLRRLAPLTVSYNGTTGRYDVAAAAGAVRHVEAADMVRIDSIIDPLLAPHIAGVFRAAARVEAAAARAGANPVPSVELHQTAGEPLSREDRQALVNGWAAARSGKNGGVAYTSPTIEARMHGQAPEQLLIAGRNAAALDIARAMGFPAWAVDAAVSGSSITYSNVPSRARELVDYVLAPYLGAIRARLSMDDVLPRGVWCRWDLSQLTRGDLKDRMDAYAAGITAGVLTVDEARALEAEAPLEGATP